MYMQMSSTFFFLSPFVFGLFGPFLVSALSVLSVLSVLVQRLVLVGFFGETFWEQMFWGPGISSR